MWGGRVGAASYENRLSDQPGPRGWDMAVQITILESAAPLQSAERKDGGQMGAQMDAQGPCTSSKDPPDLLNRGRADCRG